jgi:hypothetical protein
LLNHIGGAVVATSGQVREASVPWEGGVIGKEDSIANNDKAVASTRECDVSAARIGDETIDTLSIGADESEDDVRIFATLDRVDVGGGDSDLETWQNVFNAEALELVHCNDNNVRGCNAVGDEGVDSTDSNFDLAVVVATVIHWGVWGSLGGRAVNEGNGRVGNGPRKCAWDVSIGVCDTILKLAVVEGSWGEMGESGVHAILLVESGAVGASGVKALEERDGETTLCCGFGEDERC